MVQIQAATGPPQETIIIVLRLNTPQPEPLSPRGLWEQWQREGAEIFVRSIRGSGVSLFALELDGGTLGQAVAAPGEGFQAAQNALTALRAFVATKLQDPNLRSELSGRCLPPALETLTGREGLSGCVFETVRTPYHHKNTLLTVPCPI